MGFDWPAIEADFREQTRGLDDLSLDRERIEAFARGIAAGQLTAASNRLPAPVRPANEAEVAALDALPEAERRRLIRLGESAIDAGRVAVAVLNGGMATRFGGGVKGIVEAVGGRSFLEIKLAQARARARVPFLVMNSFATHTSTLEFLSSRGLDTSVRVFLQSVSLRLTREGEVFRGRDGRISLYAPGHGDFSAALQRSGLIERLRQEGVELVTLSNVDNLGAELDPLLIGFHLDSGCPLSAEVARTVPGDAGGAPAFVDGVLQIVEGFRYPEGFDASRLVFLATNTFALSLDLLAQDHSLTWFYVEKSVDDRPAVQMERLVNELSARVETAFVAVPRDGSHGRFFPIKTWDDLEQLRSDSALVHRFGTAGADGL